MRINTNVSALNAYRNLYDTDMRLNKSLERLSSGLRVNRAADDAAGLAISEKMRGQISGLDQAVRNAQDGISLIQTAEGALIETSAILVRMRTLAVQCATDTYLDADRALAQLEIAELIDEIDRIASDTEFNKMALLDGTFTTKLFHIGANATQNISVSIDNMDATNLGVNAVNIDSQTGADSAITIIDGAIEDVAGERATLGAIQNRLEHTVRNLSVASENLSASESRIRDADIALETIDFTRNQIMLQAGTAMLAHANIRPQAVLTLLS
ncbi:MAG: flagellin [Firmicutes bacterium]|nr:flagellin [Bacillota bacterium]